MKDALAFQSFLNCSGAISDVLTVTIRVDAMSVMKGSMEGGTKLVIGRLQPSTEPIPLPYVFTVMASVLSYPRDQLIKSGDNVITNIGQRIKADLISEAQRMNCQDKWAFMGKPMGRTR